MLKQFGCWQKMYYLSISEEEKPINTGSSPLFVQNQFFQCGYKNYRWIFFGGTVFQSEEQF